MSLTRLLLAEMQTVESQIDIFTVMHATRCMKMTRLNSEIAELEINNAQNYTAMERETLQKSTINIFDMDCQYTNIFVKQYRIDACNIEYICEPVSHRRV